ncbi:hypothetical protein [Thalassobacillus sp. CUG 92003]|uniref:hypothetical protein n=1 Tax=Thalassobacillus sp. CUG 92003 TaxID=2736641 RepID=UPI0015E79617|nr:hypothetical protein [Thalassobacillus sp. CUG 92003]
MGKRTAISSLGILLSGLILLVRPKKAQAPSSGNDEECYPGTAIAIQPGDLLFSPIGKRDSKYVGHVGMVDHHRNIVHSIPAGLVHDTIADFFRKFRAITIYAPKNIEMGKRAADYLEDLYTTYPHTEYRVFTPLKHMPNAQYCTKIVWQCYYYGAHVNLGRLMGQARAIHPVFLKDGRFLHRKGRRL